ncbi:hypothetical protein TUM3794_19870 [Shewanella colwelliana]|uniref:Uncharacterized protein n=1 Tax=Shewanella colwelliana TaxID=23 RepID=A0ABQ4P079_SHECO|nr:hypothetical protein [Shewanella colwelliana]GIU40883.1 hypothetical protein TUM3794_19870 [Shewanella colwelliana]
MSKPNLVEGIFDSATRILTIGTTKTCAFKVTGAVLNSDLRLEKLTTWARKQNLINENGVIAEI